MCGIAGIVACDRLDADASSRAIRMRDIMTHRGPDEAGLHVDRHAALAHRRLSIVDLTSGQQPMSNEDATVWIVFNGEIYNHADVRRELEQSGHLYRSKSDTETIVHAYEEWGDDCVQRLRGMFAFAIWDAPKRRLLLVRDRLGIKPLYWCRTRDGLLFGSEIKAILASDLIEAQPNEAVLPELLATRYTAGADTLFRGIQKLLPGHRLVFQNGTVDIRQYWDIPQRERGSASLSGERGPDVVRRFRELLEESVRLRLMADVPLGMFLSGGIDSSAIAALMARMIDRPLQAFSVAFKERAFNELEYARAVARAIGAVGHEVVIDDHDFFGALPKLVWHEDEPIAHPSSVPLYFVSALAGRHVKVVLTGEGSDELLAGYDKYRKTVYNLALGRAYHGALPGPLRRAIAQAILNYNGNGPSRFRQKLSRTFLALLPEIEEIYFDNFSVFSRAMQRQLFTAA